MTRIKKVVHAVKTNPTSTFLMSASYIIKVLRQYSHQLQRYQDLSSVLQGLAGAHLSNYIAHQNP